MISIRRFDCIQNKKITMIIFKCGVPLNVRPGNISRKSQLLKALMPLHNGGSTPLRELVLYSVTQAIPLSGHHPPQSTSLIEITSMDFCQESK